jgi:Fe-S-cluster containining protein
MQRQSLSGCALCAAWGKTCRQSRETPVTEGHEGRIAASTGEQEFWEHAHPDDPYYWDQDDDPDWRNWASRPGGSRPILRRQPSGDCRFLTSTGGTLPLDVRPLVCRLYPYTCTECGIDGVSEDCPGELIPPGQAILPVLEMRKADAIRCRRMLCTELRAKEARNADRVDVRPAG